MLNVNKMNIITRSSHKFLNSQYCSSNHISSFYDLPDLLPNEELAMSTLAMSSINQCKTNHQILLLTSLISHVKIADYFFSPHHKNIKINFRPNNRPKLKVELDFIDLKSMYYNLNSDSASPPNLVGQ